MSSEDAFVIAPGFVDLQVNGFAGVDYNSPVASHEEIARSIRAMFSTGVTRFFPTVITGAPDRDAGRAAESGGGARIAGGRRGDGGVSRRGSAYFRRGRSARGASGALGSPARFRRVSPLAGRRARQCAIGHAVAGMARGDSLHRTAGARRRGDQHRPHRRDARADPRRGQRRSDAFNASGQWRAMRCLPAVRITSGTSWPRIGWRRASSSTASIYRIHSFERRLRAKGIERSVLVTDAVMPAHVCAGPLSFWAKSRSS